jgi:hypothetical protein
MSVHERIDIDHKGTDKVTGIEWCTGGALVHARDCRGSGSERAPGVATSSGVNRQVRRVMASSLT